MAGHGSSWGGRSTVAHGGLAGGAGRWSSAEVAAPGRGVEVEGPELLGDHVHHPLGALQAAAHQQGGGGGGHPPVKAALLMVGVVVLLLLAAAGAVRG